MPPIASSTRSLMPVGADVAVLIVRLLRGCGRGLRERPAGEKGVGATPERTSPPAGAL
ncbi:hypothetical protein GCM10010442_25700 [Kitasatospora kifunensis]